jgi:hypothetical protein
VVDGTCCRSLIAGKAAADLVRLAQEQRLALTGPDGPDRDGVSGARQLTHAPAPLRWPRVLLEEFSPDPQSDHNEDDDSAK